MPDPNLGLIAALVPAGALAFALYQYRINSLSSQRQRAREQAIQAANEMEAFRDDAAASLALKMIDYEEISIDVPVDFGADPPQKVRVNREMLILALEVHTDRAKRLNLSSSRPVQKAELFSDTELTIRDIFDRFLVRLERIESLVRAGVIGRKQFGDLFSYWFKLLAERPQAEDMGLIHFGNRRRRQLWKYIRIYEYNGVVRLFQMYGRAAPVGTEPDEAFRAKLHPIQSEPSS
jgi:hypothetical protein